MKKPHRMLFVASLATLAACNSQAHQLHPQVSRAPAYTPSHQYAETHAGKRIARLASRQVGIRYRYGGSNRRGFDCSGLVHYTHKRTGIQVPRMAADQLRYSQRVAMSRLRPGDLLFFDLGTRKISHVGIYVGNSRFIHAPSRGKRVSYASLENPYWQRRIIAAGRYY